MICHLQHSHSKSPSLPLLQEVMAGAAVLPEVPSWNLHDNDHLDSSSLSRMICANVTGIERSAIQHASTKKMKSTEVTQDQFTFGIFLNWVFNWFAIQGTVRIDQSTAVMVPVRCLPAQHVILRSSLFVSFLSSCIECSVQYKPLLLDLITYLSTNVIYIDCCLGSWHDSLKD